MISQVSYFKIFFFPYLSLSKISKISIEKEDKFYLCACSAKLFIQILIGKCPSFNS